MAHKVPRMLVGAAVGVLLTSALAACGSGSPQSSGGSKDVEVFTYWTSGGEKAGLDGLVSTFNTDCKGENFVNSAIAGGTGSNAKQVLASRLQQNDPPETWQVHAGAEITDFIKAEQVEDLTADYKEWGLDKAFPQGLIDSLTYNGKIYSVPANIHRIMLWSNTDVLKGAGITAEPKNVNDLVANLTKLKASGVTPLAMGVDWTQLELLESILLANLGPEKFSTLWDQGADWKSSDLDSSFDTYKQILTYTNDDRDTLDWTDAEKLLVGGKAGYQLMGDWELGELNADKFTGYGVQPFPGTEGTYQWLADSFVLPKGAKNAEGAKCWLKTVGSAAGQKAFNTKKGSIPARVDASPADYPKYQQSAMADFKDKAIAPSCAHGSACTTAEVSAIQSALGKFSQGGDISGLRESINAAVSQNGPAKN